MKIQKIHPCLWFDDQAEDAAKHYVSIFARSKITRVSRYGEGGMGKPGSVMLVDFQLDGLRLSALNGGPHFKLTPAISLSVSCETQKEVDTLWRKLVKGGKPSRCGWLEDRFGLSWQIVPEVLPRLMRDRNPAKVMAVTQAMLTMVKLDSAKLQRAYDRA